MATIQWRPEVNALTVPQSYWIRFVPRRTASRKDIAADIAKKHPFCSAELAEMILKAGEESVQERLLNGEQVTFDGSFSWYLSFTGRLDSPDDPLPPVDECLQVSVRISQPFVAALRQDAQLERLPVEKKLPLLLNAEDTLLKLRDVLNPDGVLQLTGENLSFDPTAEDAGGCVIEGTRSGRSAQRRLVRIEPGGILLMPDIPAQANPWNNEYTVSVSTRYSERGTLRTGTYSRKLRTPLAVNGFASETGILTGRAGNPYVSITGGSLSAGETLRIEAVMDLAQDSLLLRLADMAEKGRAGAAAPVTGNGEITLAGFSGSALSSLTVRVNAYAALKEMIRNDYSGRLTDVLILATS
jgi:hypothetical protein